MKTLIKIAWRNIWRNKLRSSLVILSIVLGIWAGLFIMAMTLGLNEQRMSGAVNTYLSHVQVHHPKYMEDQNMKFFLEDKQQTIEAIKSSTKVKAYAERVLSVGMVANSKGSVGVQILGVNPEQEKLLTTIHNQLDTGTYFEKYKGKSVIIGRKLADKLHLKLKSKIVATLQDINGNIVSTSFRVEGIFKTNSSVFDGSSIFVKQEKLSSIIGAGNEIHEIAILCDKIESTDEVVTVIESKDRLNKVDGWADIAPELGYAQEVMGSMIYIFMGIVLIALAFSIINTMLMAVLERKKELGMLMAVGMNKKRIFSMIVFETVFISMLATPIGMLLSILTINHFGEYGIDLSAVAEGLESLGVGSKIYTSLPIDLYFKITVLTIIIAFLASLFPAKKALNLKPTEAIS